MAHPIPEQFIIKTNLNLGEENYPLDFELQFTVFGELLSVENQFFELPKEAQALMLGQKEFRQLDYYVEYFRFLLPLVAIGLVNYAKIWSIRNELVLLRTLPAYKRLYTKTHIQDKWVQKAWSFSKYPRKEHLSAVKLLISDDIESMRRGLRKIKTDNFLLVEPVLFNLLKLPLKHDDKLEIYSVLGHHQSRDFLEIILEQLANPHQQSQHEFALYGLSFYNEVNVRERLLYYYKFKHELNQESEQLLLQALGNYKTKKILAVLFKEMIEGRELARDQALKSLRKLGISRKELCRKLKIIFDARPSKKIMINVLDLYDKVGSRFYLPTTKALIDLLIWANEGKVVIEINTRIGVLLAKRTFFSKRLQTLVALMQDERKEIRTGAIQALVELLKLSGNSKIAKHLITNIDTESSSLKLELIKGLALLKGSQANLALVKMQRDSDVVVSQTAKSTLRKVKETRELKTEKWRKKYEANEKIIQIIFLMFCSFLLLWFLTTRFN